MKKDFGLALSAGLLAGVFLIPTLRNLNLSLPYEYGLLFLGLPLLALGGMLISHLLAKKINIILQIAKFSVVGGLNATIDFGVLNILILWSGIAAGFYFAVFKGLSFIAANISSYFWNKYWTFNERSRSSMTGEYIKFLIVSMGGLILNVGIASLVVNLVDPRLGATPEIWANFGAVVGVLGNFFWNFIGYKFIVFKSEDGPGSVSQIPSSNF